VTVIRPSPCEVRKGNDTTSRACCPRRGVERTPDVHESMHSLVRFSRQMERRPRRQSAGLPLKHHLPFRARPVVPVCGGRHWLGHSRNRGAACADVSGIASWPEPRSGQTVSSLEIYGGGTTVGGSVLAIIVGRCDSRDCRSKINTDRGLRRHPALAASTCALYSRFTRSPEVAAYFGARWRWWCSPPLLPRWKRVGKRA